MHANYLALKAAMDADALIAAIDIIVDIATAHIEKGEKGRAADILALALFYPMDIDTRNRAETMFMDLEAELCPRVILDAKTRAQEITLDEMVNEILNEPAA